MRSLVILLMLFAGYSACVSSAEHEDTARLLNALTTGNHFVLLRHALAPGTGDPAHFDVNDCNTQRNLNEVGRVQARKIGGRLRAAGIDQAQVYTSQWCRCIETARLLQVGPVADLASLNSFYEAPQNRERQTRELRDWLSDLALDRPIVLVTHQVNISALTGVYVSSGEMVIVKRIGKNELQVIGTIKAGSE